MNPIIQYILYLAIGLFSGVMSGMFGIGGSVAGAFLTGYFSKLELAIIFVIISVLTVIGVYLYKLAPSISAKIKPNFWNISIGGSLLNLIN